MLRNKDITFVNKKDCMLIISCHDVVDGICRVYADVPLVLSAVLLYQLFELAFEHFLGRDEDWFQGFMLIEIFSHQKHDEWFALAWT